MENLENATHLSSRPLFGTRNKSPAEMLAFLASPDDRRPLSPSNFADRGSAGRRSMPAAAAEQHGGGRRRRGGGGGGSNHTNSSKHKNTQQHTPPSGASAASVTAAEESVVGRPALRGHASGIAMAKDSIQTSRQHANHGGSCQTRIGSTTL